MREDCSLKKRQHAQARVKHMRKREEREEREGCREVERKKEGKQRDRESERQYMHRTCSRFSRTSRSSRDPLRAFVAKSLER